MNVRIIFDIFVDFVSVNLKICGRLRNLVIFEVFGLKFSAKNRFSKFQPSKGI